MSAAKHEKVSPESWKLTGSWLGTWKVFAGIGAVGLLASGAGFAGDPRRFDPGPFDLLRAHRGRAQAERERDEGAACREEAGGAHASAPVEDGVSARVRISSTRRAVKSSIETTSCFFPAPRTRIATCPDSASRFPSTAM